MKKFHIQNLSNEYYSVSIDDIREDLGNVVKQSNNSVSGIEIKLTKNQTRYTLITPPFIKSNKYNNEYKTPNLEGYTFYEGYLHHPFFLPIYDKLDGEFISQLEEIKDSLSDIDTLYMQWLFSRTNNWQDTALQMYSSYILGNNFPVAFKAIRKLQDKALHFLNKIGSITETRDYIEEAEQKIVSEGYRFQLRIATNSPLRIQEHIISKLEELFHQYTSYNTIQLTKARGENLIEYYNNCIMTSNTKYQILTMREILSIFGGNNTEDVLVETVDKPSRNTTVNSVIELLPDYPLQKVDVKGDIAQDIAEALKRVGITNQARIYKSTVTTGVRLTIVQFDIPKGKNLTDITKKQKDIQAVLGVESLSIEQGSEPDTVKFSIPNEKPTIVGLRNLLEQESFKEYCKENDLPFIVGVDEINNPIYLSLSKLPHLLISGTTGSGKSVMLANLITTLLLTNAPKELELVLIDPKLVEFQHFGDFIHVKELITDMDKATNVLDRLTEEMDNRYSQFLKLGVKRIDLYNQKILNSEKPLNIPLMPYKVCVIDEYADLYDTNPDVENYIARLGQKARSAGIHLIIATQRPSSDIVSGKIKANIPNAISFNLSNTNNYRTVFGKGIPYSLLGKGDGVMKIESYHKEFQRFQSPIISPDELIEEKVYRKLAEHLNKQNENFKLEKFKNEELEGEVNIVDNVEEDENLIKLKQIIADTGEVRSVELRKMMGIKNTTLSELMNQLVEEGWLEKGRSKAEGYRLVVGEEELDKWRN